MSQSFDIMSDIFNKGSAIHKVNALSSWKVYIPDPNSKDIQSTAQKSNAPKPNEPKSKSPKPSKPKAAKPKQTKGTSKMQIEETKQEPKEEVETK